MKRPKATVYHPDEGELRRWCIEQAIRWPVYLAGAQAGAFGQFPPQPQEHDVLGRAKRLLDWVKGKPA